MIKETRALVQASMHTDQDMVLKGTIPYEKESLWMGFTEVLKTGCFRKTVRESKDLHFLEEHDDSKLRARGKNGSLKVTEDNEGVHFEAHLIDTTENRDLYAKVKAGLLSNVSFGFSVVKDRRTSTGLREILEARLFEISAVGSPAYEDTTLFTRSLSSAFEGKELSEEDKTSIQDEIAKLQGMLEDPTASEPQPEPEPQPEDHQEEPVEEVATDPTPEEPKVEPTTPPEEPQVDSHYLDLVARCDALERLLKELEV